MSDEPRADPLFEYEGVVKSDNVPAVLAYRIGQMEGHIRSVTHELKEFMQNYPTKELLDLIIKPIHDDIRELKTASEEKRTYEKHVKLAIVAAILNPIFSVAIALLVNQGTAL